MHTFRSVSLDDQRGELVILDQTRLPNDLVYLRLSRTEDIWEAIRNLRVRGAPAIGIAAAYGAYLAVRNGGAESLEAGTALFRQAKQYLETSRPTAVNLFWALNRMEQRLVTELRAEASPDSDARSLAHLIHALKEEADAIRDEDARMCRAIGEHALSLLQRDWGLLTHCNAGALATSELGTALAPIYLGAQRDYQFKVFADETRPLLQGARLTAWELSEARIDVTLICDNMAASVMKRGLVQAVLVGCDRVAANGDTANKIGTLGVAILARHYGIPFYVLGPTSTVDLKCSDGASIVIEERPGEEITTQWYSSRMAPQNIKTYNPAFDVTDASLITAIITEKGIARPPFAASLRELAR
ncbi:MAG TPA: S-methyl-5-thioribose-1-phosphate isomerase [Spirochaetaceae bacterium]|nr:S-methyl-5-thioribose-1-phosphate isomerase [Spirochaetaceae bacterium]